MEVKTLKKALFLTFFVGLLIFGSLTPISASAEESKGTNTPASTQVEYYDANNKLVSVESYTEEKQATSTPSTKFFSLAASKKGVSYYDFGKTTFSNYIWVKGGYAFKNPGAMSIELNNRPKQFEVRMYASNKKTYIGKGVAKNASGWVPFDWRSLRKKGSSYTFKLVSAANSGKITVNNGTLEYNVN